VYGIFVHEQVKALIESGCRVEVVSPLRWAPFPINKLKPGIGANSQVPNRLVREGVSVRYPRFPLLPRAMFFHSSGPIMYRSARQTIRSVFREFPFDVIHAHVALPDGYAAMKLGEELERPKVVTVHGADIYQNVYRSRRCRRMVSEILDKAAKTIFVSNRLRDLAEERTGRSFDSVVIGNGVSPELHTEPRADSGDTSKPLTIFSASYLVPRKAVRYNISALAETLKKHRNMRYVIAGDGPELKDLVKLASDLGVTDQVEFVGLLSHRETVESMSSADVFSLPSWDEAFGVVYIEAMAQGKPVIACRGEGIEDVISHGVNGLLVEPRNVDSLADAFEFLITHPDEARSMGERARRHIMQNYTWAENAKKTLNVYEEVVAGWKA